MPSRRTLERLIAEDEALIVRMKATLEQMERGVEAMKSALEAHISAEQALSTIEAQRSMLGSKMELQNTGANKRVRIAATMTAGATKAKRALLEAGLTPQDVADKRKVGRSTVDAWCRGTRAIPRAHRDWLEEKHGIPGRVWPKTTD